MKSEISRERGLVALDGNGEGRKEIERRRPLPSSLGLESRRILVSFR